MGFADLYAKSQKKRASTKPVEPRLEDGPTDSMAENSPARQLPGDPCLALFVRASEAINRRYLEGTIAWIADNCPELDGQINRAEDKVNQLWADYESGKASWDDFRETVRAWYDLNIEAIEIFRGRGARDSKQGIQGLQDTAAPGKTGGTQEGLGI